MGKDAHPSTVLHALPSRDSPTYGAGSLHTLCHRDESVSIPKSTSQVQQVLDLQCFGTACLAELYQMGRGEQ